MAPKFSDKFLNSQKNKLLQIKNKIVFELRFGEIEDRSVSPDQVIEEGDWARVEQSRELSYTMKERKLKQLHEVEYALAKFELGTYGICEESGELIDEKRLINQPWARLSLYYAELAEMESKRAA